MGKYYVGDIGTEILVDTLSDIDAATKVELKIKKPDGTEEAWTGAVTETTKITYTIVSGDFDQEGSYKLQAYVEIAGGKWYGDLVTFQVYDQFR